MILHSLLMLFLKGYRVSSALLVIKDLLEKGLVWRIYYYYSFDNYNSCKTNLSLWYSKSQFVITFVKERQLWKYILISSWLKVTEVFSLWFQLFPKSSLENAYWIGSWEQKVIHISAQFAILVFSKATMKIHFESVSENKNSFKCSIYT